MFVIYEEMNMRLHQCIGYDVNIKAKGVSFEHYQIFPIVLH